MEIFRNWCVDVDKVILLIKRCFNICLSLSDVSSALMNIHTPGMSHYKMLQKVEQLC